MSKSICAVVVTYNRKQQLLACLNALNKQSYPLEHIVVINNASQDGTIDHLKQHYWENSEKFTLLNLETNQGGAGGFFAGIEFAYKQQFDYIWLMDDDGIPDRYCLAELMKNIDQNSYIGPLVLDIDNPDNLTFTLRLPKSRRVLVTEYDVKNSCTENILPEIVMPFNGILFSRNLVKKVGLPKKEFFIWGDDIEYTWRAKKEGFNIFTVITAHFYHPREKTLGTPMFFNQLKFNDTESKIKLYCMSRNNIRNLLDYKSKLISTLFIIKIIWFYLFTKPNLRKLKLALTGVWHGLTKNFTQHKKYIP